MTWQFDSGLPAPMRTVVRNAMIAKLAPLSRAGGGWLEAVIPIGFLIRGPHDDLGIDNLWTTLNGRVPAIAVSTGKLATQDGGLSEVGRARLTVELYLVSSHRRGITDGRVAGDVAAAANNSADPGLDAALELTWMYLHAAKLGISAQVSAPSFVEEDEIIAEPEKTIWQQTWQVLVTRDVNQLRASVKKVMGLGTTLRPQGDEPASQHIVLKTDV